MKKLLVFLLLPLFLFGYQVQIKEWGQHHTFFGFLKENKIPLSVFYNLNKKIRKDLASISSRTEIYLLKNGNIIKQALIPFNDKKQLQIIKNGDNYVTKIVPIQYTITKKVAKIKVTNFLSYDIYKKTKNPYISRKLASIFADRINFRVLPKNTMIDVYYDVKSRFGKIVNIDIIYAQIKNRYYDISAYKYTDGRYYDAKGRSLKGMFLPFPMKYTRISSPFGRRFHPILHKWRMHDGIDYVNKVGTPIHSVADGKVIYKGWIRGYGNAVKIKHKNGYMTLYGHMKGFGHIRLGEYIKQGKVIGYMGNTGLSTGPHLHFGVMRYNKWINPVRIKKSAKIKLYGRKRKKFFAYVDKIQTTLNNRVAMK